MTAKAEAARVVAEALPEGERRRRSEGGLGNGNHCPPESSQDLPQ